MDVLQRNGSSESEESAAKPDFAPATHTIMGVLHQVMQVRLGATCRQGRVTADRGENGPGPSPVCSGSP